MVGLSSLMNDSNVVAPIRSPAAAKIVLGFWARSASTAPAYLAAPGMSRSGRSRPWKSLVPITWMSTGSAAWAGDVLVRPRVEATRPSPRATATLLGDAGMRELRAR